MWKKTIAFIPLAITPIVPLFFLTLANAQSSDSAMGASSSITTVLPVGPGKSTPVIVKGKDPAPCPLPWGGTITSGNSVTAYATNSSSNCAAVAQTRSCIDGSLSGSYSYNSCYSPPPPPPAPPPVVVTPSPPPPAAVPWFKQPGNARNYTIVTTRSTDYGNINITTSGTFSGTYHEEWCNFNGGAYQYNGSSCLYQGTWYPANTAGVTVSKASYNFIGTVANDGQFSGTWSVIGGGASGAIAGRASGTTLLGQNTGANGGVSSWTAR